MNTKIFAILFLSLATELLGSSRIEINAVDIDSFNDTLQASNDVLAFNNESMIKAIQATYNQKSTVMLLDGNVEILEYDKKNIISDKIYINSNEENSSYEDIFISTQEDFWLYSDKIERKGDQYRFGNSILSSCSIKNPDWIMAFERSLYDANTSKMKVYHAKVYAGDIPLFYFPYLSFSTRQERSSGLLFPLLSYNQNDGFIYEQPLYIAPYDNWDLELNPQIRTNRSKGIYGTLRFKDTPHSYGSLRVGYFEDKEEYIQENNLKNDTHYGLQFYYDSAKVLDIDGFKDGLYTNITLLNDIDYLNLQKDQLRSLLGANSYIRESRLNYFLHNDHYYFGFYGKYFIDTRKIDNDDTIQELPTLHLHKSTTALYNNLFYSVDLKSYNYYRKEGVRAKKIDFFLPFSYSRSFVDNYINLELSQNIYASKVFFTSSDDDKLDNYKYYMTYFKAELSSELTRFYGKYIHTIRPFAYYMRPSKSQESVVNYDNLVDEAKELFSIDTIEPLMMVGLSHYLYNKSGELKIYHRLLYNYYLDREDTPGDIRNEVGYYGDHFTIYNNLIYSQEYNKIKSSLTSIGFNKSDLYIGGTYYYNYDFSRSIQTKSLGLNFHYRINESLNILGGANYDLEKNYKTQWRFGLKYDRDCWSISALFKEDVQPILTTSGASYQENTSLTFQFNIVPFGGIGNN